MLFVLNFLFFATTPMIFLLVGHEDSEEDDLPPLGQHDASSSDGRFKHHMLPGQSKVRDDEWEPDSDDY